MNSRQKEVLSSCRSLLTRNIIWTPQFLNLLQEQGVLTDSMLADIEAAPERQEKIQLLLDVLPLRRTQAFEKFCDVLHLTGHLFLSDFLRDEETKKELLEVTDVYRRVPAVVRLKDAEKKQLEAYIAEKVQSEVMKVSWKRDTKDKEKWLDTKQRQLDDAKEFEEERRTTLDRISQLEQALQEAKDALVETRAERRSLERRLVELQDKHKENMNIQIKYNTANDAAIQRSGEKVGMMVDLLRSIHNRLNDVISLKIRDSERELMAVSENEFAFLLEDFDTLLSSYKDLLKVKDAYEDLIEERNLMLLHLGHAPEDKEATSLLAAFKDFAVRNDEEVHQLREKLSRYGEMIKEQEQRKERDSKENSDKSDGQEQEVPKSRLASGAAVWQAAIMTVMRKQLNDLKVESRKKNTQISLQEDEISKLKAKLSALEKQLEKAKERTKELEQINEARQSVNGRLSVSLESLDGRTDAGRPSSILPPIRFGQIQAPSYSPVGRPVVQLRKQQPTVSRTYQPEHQLITLPDGLTSAPVRLENRGKNPMGNVVGDLKSLHNRHRTSAYNGRASMTVNKSGSVPSAVRKTNSKIRI